jgi:hypothetical protein
MGTGSLVRFIRRHGIKKDKPKYSTITAIYQQYDGYPKNGVGENLGKFLKSRKLCNGIPLQKNPFPATAWANGLECLAAQYIAQFKKGAGGLYVVAPDSENAVWTYEVLGDDEGFSPEIVKVEAFSGEESKFQGDVEEFLKWAHEYDHSK